MSKEEIVAFLNDMIDALTWKRAGLLFLLGSIVVVLLMAFENRTTLFNRLVNQAPIERIDVPWEVSEDSKSELTALTQRPLISGVLLTQVDLRQNRRITKFWYVSDATFRQQANKIASSLLPQAFFDTDSKNNEQMLSVLSNQFVCTAAEDTVFIRFFPDIQKQFPTVCRLAVPPFTGKFAGLVTVLLNKKPTSAEVDSLKIEITRVAVELYLRDIQNQGGKK